MNKSKAAQIGVFVVIGAILVIGLIFLVSLNFDKIKVFNNDKSSFKIKEYVEKCLYDVTDEGINRLGRTGGHLYHVPMIFSERGKSSYENRIAEGLNFLEKNEMPYWYFYDDTDEEFKYNFPEYDTDSKYSIKNQLKTYLDENIDVCLANFLPYKDIYSVDYDPDEIDIIVQLREDEIRIDLNMATKIVEINTEGEEFISNYRIDFENKLYVPYHLAKDIAIAESQSSFIEKRIIQLLTPYQTSETRDSLPPYYDFKIAYDFRPWKVSEVETKVKNIMSSEISRIQFLNTDYALPNVPSEIEDSEFVQGFTKMYVKDYLKEHSLTANENKALFTKYEDYKVNPTFEVFTPMYFGISPSFGNSILLPQPEALISILPFFFTQYNAVYEISAPIIFEIDSNPNDRFVFNLPLEINIDYNSALKESLERETLPPESYPQNEKSLICDPPQFISDYVTLNISDPINFGKRTLDNNIKNGVDEAFVTFNCKGIATCYIGQTEINGRNGLDEITNLKFRLPINCEDSTLEVYKFGHEKLTIENLNPRIDQAIDLGIYEMASSKEMEIDFTIKNVFASSSSEGRSLRPEETAFVVFENKKTEDFVNVLEVNFTNQNNLQLDFLPGNYTVTGFITYNDEIVIAEEEICFKSGLFSEDCETLPEIQLDSWISGGIEIEDFEVRVKDLLNTNTIKLNFIDFGIPKSYSDMESLSEAVTDLEASSLNHKPEFEK